MSALRDRVLLREAIQLMLREAEGAKLVFNQVVPWPADVRRVPYGKTEGVGPGEQRLAKILGGEVQGGSATFDLETPLGRFEVKEPKGNLNGEVRVESEGIAAIEANLGRIKNVAKRIDSVFGTGSRAKTAAAAQQLYPPDVYQKIRDFATKPETKDQTAIQWILRGEIGQRRMQALADTLRLISTGLKGPVKEEKYVELGDTDVGSHERRSDLSTHTFVKVAQAAGIEPDLLQVSSADVLRSTLNGTPFTNPEKFILSVLQQPVKASDVFGHTDGLILVRPEGYMVIPRRDFDSRMRFTRISKGKPYFALDGAAGDES
jgi:hypothetical protein